jgi:hypothetical protein
MLPPIDREEALKPGKGFLTALIVCAVLWAMIIVLMILVFAREQESRPAPMISAWQERKILHYFKARKMKPQVILIRWNGKMTYTLEGKRCEIK